MGWTENVKDAGWVTGFWKWDHLREDVAIRFPVD
jgi:hypothetical protein